MCLLLICSVCCASQPLKQARLALNLYSHNSLSLSVCRRLFSSLSQKQKKLAVSKLQHDDSYLKSIPKTSYYLVGFVPESKNVKKTPEWNEFVHWSMSRASLWCPPKSPVTFSLSEIFDLQRQLAQCGHLNTHHDMEDFYRHIKYGRHPSQLHRSLEAVRKKSWVTALKKLSLDMYHGKR